MLSQLDVESRHPAPTHGSRWCCDWTGGSCVNTSMGVRPATIRIILLVALFGFAVRLSRWPTWGHMVLGDRSYDPAVMYSASTALANGQMPYRDFVFLHPPGVLIAFLPAVWLGEFFGAAQGLALTRLGVVLLGAINTALVGLLLRKYGTVAVLAGAGAYAGWGAIAHTEQIPLLEPPLATALFVALLLARKNKRGTLFAIGAVLALAALTKIWAVVDLMILAVWVGLRYGSKALAWFATGVASTGLALGLPFFLAAPRPMWDMIVATQAGRPSTGVSLVLRARTFGPLDGRGFLAYELLVIATMMLLLVTCFGVLILSVRGSSPRTVPETGLWALIVLAHFALLSISPSFYGHYAHFGAAPLALVIGYVVSRVTDILPTHERSLSRGRIAMLFATNFVVLGLAAASITFSLYWALTTDHITKDEQNQLVDWARTRSCTWGNVGTVALADAVTSNLNTSDCPFLIDAFGVDLFERFQETLDIRYHPSPPSAWEQILAADGVIQPIDLNKWVLTETERAKFRSQYVHVVDLGEYSIWNRSHA